MSAHVRVHTLPPSIARIAGAARNLSISLIHRQGKIFLLLLCVFTLPGIALLSQAQTAPSVSAVIIASNFGGFSTVAPGCWIEIHGSNLANDTEGWTFDQFLTPHSGTSLSSVQVSVAGRPAFVSFASPGQINAQLPAELPTGTQHLTVTNANGTSAAFAITLHRTAPGLWAPPAFVFPEATYVAALFSDGVTYALPPGAGVDLNLPAKYPRPGDIITMYGVGFGPVAPQDVQPDKVTTVPNHLDLPFHLFYGSTEARVVFAGLDPNLMGFYRFDVVVPDIDPRDRDAIPLTFTLGGIPGTQQLFTDESNHNATQESVIVDGAPRTYLLYVPRNYQPGSPLIVALHGRGEGGPGSVMELISDLNDKADRTGFAVAYPDGLVDAEGAVDWNFYYGPFYITPPDDVAFIREVIDTLQARLHPDPRRIYVAGTSAGGFMAQRIGVELSDRVAAIGVVEGQLFVTTSTSPQTVPSATAPISVLLLKGDQDPNNLYCGAIFPQFDITEASADQDFDYWTGSSANQCTHFDTTAPLCNSVGIFNADGTGTPGELSSLVEKDATGCKQGTEVKFYRILGGVDRWNQNPMNIPSQIPFNPDFNVHTGVTTSDILWKFFAEHPKPESHSAQ